MKYYRFILQPIKERIFHVLSLNILLGCFLFCSCEDNIEQPSYSSRMVFKSEIRSSWTSSTRSTTEVNEVSSAVTALQGSGKTLFLHTLYTDSIASVFTEDCCDTTVLTRATPVTNANMYHSFGISAYSYIGSWSESRMPNYFYNATATKNGNTYTLPSTYYWPGVSYKMKFFAYAPVEKGRYQLSGIDYPGSPILNVRIPGDVNEQADLLVANTEEVSGNHGSTVPLAFHHALTAIRIECGSDLQDGTVKSVSLKNVYSKGGFNLGTLSWEHVNSPATFSQTLNKSTSGTPGEILTTDAQTFMMLPQILPEGAQLEVVFTDNTGTNHTLTASINGMRWPIGKTVTYKISSSSINWTYTLNVSKPDDFTYVGGTQYYSVTSFRQSSKGIKEAVAWSVQYSEDGIHWTNTKPEWLTAFTSSGAGGTTAQSYDATVSSQKGIDDNPHVTALRNASPKGTKATPYNLANQSNGGATNENTANCYVVNAPGYYSFPLVYGNAIRNGKNNTSAYTTGMGLYLLRMFINHTGNTITNPYIINNICCVPSKAELVWQDEPNLLTEINYNIGLNGGCISFKVDKKTIRQGNAVIAIKNERNQILWSWHIWVTDENINKMIAVTNNQDVVYNMMPVNLGWCDGYTITYAERSCRVKFTAGDKKEIMIIKQAAKSITNSGNHPFYQWGRKDPFLPSNGLDNGNKTWYDKDGIASTSNPTRANLLSGSRCIKNYILNPNVMHSRNQGDDSYYNLWSVNNNSTSENNNTVIKTIYDPCPIGFKLPAVNAFTGFTTTGNSTNIEMQLNGFWDVSRNGWFFYTNSTKKQTIFFPASGFRDNSTGELRSVNKSGTYWVATPKSLSAGRHFLFYSSAVYPLNYGNRASGHAIRPSQE